MKKSHHKKNGRKNLNLKKLKITKLTNTTDVKGGMNAIINAGGTDTFCQTMCETGC